MQVWMSKLTIKNTPKALRWISSRYKIHQRLHMAFPEKKDVDNTILFHVNDDKLEIIVQSTLVPDWNKCFHEFDVLDGEPKTKPFNPVIRNGMQLKMFVNANTTKCIKVDNKSKRVGVWKEDELNNWLNRTAEFCGFKVEQCCFQNQGLLANIGKDPKAKYQSVNITSHIQITDTELFLHTLQSGIGRATFIGFGLPLLSRI